jgi:uncharacterized protein (TIGR02266 family)
MAPDPNTDEIVARYACATIDDLVAKHALDVSEGGMLLRSSCSLPIGKLVNFEIQLSNERVVLTGTGRIAWKRDARDGDRPAGVGVKFVDLDDASRALVDQLLLAKGDSIGEFERAPAPAETAKTVMGLGSPFLAAAAAAPEPASSASPPSADETRGRTKLGVSPVMLTPEERARVGTRLGLAPAVASAGLVLVVGEQSSATSDIDAGWGDEAKAGTREAAPVPAAPPAPARISQIPTVEVRLSEIPRLLDLAANVAARPEAEAAPEAETRPPPAVEEPPPKLSQARPERPRASEIVDAPASVPRRRSWSWIVLLLTVAAVGVYLYLGVPSEDPSNDVPSSVAPPETSTPAPPKSAAPPPSASPVATTGSSAVSFAGSRAAPSAAPAAAPSAAPSAPIAPPDAGKHQAPPPKPSASAKAAHAAPSTTTSAKPRPSPKPPPADDNPY